MEEHNNVTDIRQARPFERMAIHYLRAGWYPIPVPYGDKYPPPTGYTGRESAWPDEDKIAEWIAENNWNIAFHLGPVYEPMDSHFEREDGQDVDWLDMDGTPLWTVVGIDVDHYTDGEKVKLGGDQLAELEKTLGVLPDTWTSSSRQDGVSGIRYFLVPNKFSYRGKVDKDIDVIQETHRFAVAWPSAHPKGGQYAWFRPGQQPKGQGARRKWLRILGKKTSSERSTVWEDRDVIPTVWNLPFLGEKWIDHLTQGFQPRSDKDIDMDSSVDEIKAWAYETFRGKPGDGDDEPSARVAEFGCKLMKKQVEHWKDLIREDASSHDKIVAAHWNILAMGQEGHSGWSAAVEAINLFWLEDVGERGKRGGEATIEIFRSHINALRKLKAEMIPTNPETTPKKVQRGACACYEAPPAQHDEFVPTGEPKDPGDYLPNHRGNGEHFVDVFGGAEGNWRYVAGFDQWIHWDSERWTWDELGAANRAFGIVHDRQMNYVTWLKSKRMEAKMAEDKESFAKYSGLLEDWKRWSISGGNVDTIKKSLEAATSIKGVSVPFTQPDCQPHLIGVANGVVELNMDGYVFREAQREDWVINNTGTPFIPWAEQTTSELIAGRKMWTDFLKLFLPDPEIRAWTQQLFGYALFGRNIKKKFIFLYGTTNTGKSTMLNAIMAALGQYAGAFEMEMFAPGKTFNPQMLKSLPRRIVTTTEVGGDAAMDPEIMKRATGDDLLSIQRKNTDVIHERIPAFVPIIATNNAPDVKTNDEGLKSRIEVLPFDVQATPSEAGSAMTDAARVAILAWLLDGWNMFAEHQLTNKPTAKLKDVNEEFQRNMAGDISNFLEEVVEVTGDQNDLVGNPELYSAYQKWARQQNIERPWSQPVFGKKISSAGITGPKSPIRDSDGRQVKYKWGIKIRSDFGNVAKFKMQKG